MALEDLDIELNLKITKAQERLRKIRLDIHDAFKEMGEVRKDFVEIGKAANAIPTQQIDVRLKNLVAMNRTAEKFLLQTSNLERQFGRNVRDAIGKARKEMQNLAVDTRQVDTAAKSVSSSTALIRVPRRESVGNGGGGGDSGGGVNFVRVTQAAGQLAILSKVSTTLQKIGNTVASVGESGLVSATKMDRFRMGLAAPKVDPKLNIVKNSVESLTASMAGFINKARGVSDSTISGAPETLAALAVGFGKVLSSTDDSSLSLSKLVSWLQTSRTSLEGFTTMFPTAAKAMQPFKDLLDAVSPSVENASNKLDAVNAKAAESANVLRATAYVATGEFVKLGGSADLTAKSWYHAVLPLRLVKREIDGWGRVIRGSMHVWNFLSYPLHAMSVASKKASSDWRNLNSVLEKTSRQAGIVGVAHRAFARSTYIASIALKPFTSELVRAVNMTVWLTKTSVKLSMMGLRPIGRLAVAAAGGIARFGLSVAGTIGKVTGLGIVAGVTANALAKLTSVASGAGTTINSKFTVVKANTVDMGSGFSRMGMMAMAAKASILALAVAATTFGIKSAAGAEMSAVSYGTMLHDMEQGKALLASVQGWKGAPLFDTKDVEDSTRALLKAGVAPAMITDKLTELGNIASVTKTPIEDLSRMYQQGATVGKFGYGQINDMAMRGIDIWHGLADATGKSVPEVQKLAEAGQIGVAQMDAALAKLTTGTGIYAGALDNVAETSSGMFATMVNNTKMAWTAFMGAGLEAFKPVLRMGVAVSGGIATAFRRLAPIAGIIGGAMSDMFSAIARIGGNVFGNLLGNGQSLFGGILKIATTVFTTIRFFWQNFEGVAKWAFESFKLHALTTFNDFLFFFTNKAPKAVKHYFEQVKNLMLGGQWQPLGPMPERAMTEAERKLQERADALGAPLAVRLDEMLTEAEKAMADTPAMKALSDKASSYDSSSPDFGAAGSASRGASENKAINIRSSESQSVISQLLSQGKNLQKKAQNATVNMANDVNKLVKATERGNPIVTRAWA